MMKGILKATLFTLIILTQAVQSSRNSSDENFPLLEESEHNASSRTSSLDYSGTESDASELEYNLTTLFGENASEVNSVLQHDSTSLDELDAMERGEILPTAETQEPETEPVSTSTTTSRSSPNSVRRGGCRGRILIFLALAVYEVQKHVGNNLAQNAEACTNYYPPENNVNQFLMHLQHNKDWVLKDENNQSLLKFKKLSGLNQKAYYHILQQNEDGEGGDWYDTKLYIKQTRYAEEFKEFICDLGDESKAEISFSFYYHIGEIKRNGKTYRSKESLHHKEKGLETLNFVEEEDQVDGKGQLLEARISRNQYSEDRKICISTPPGEPNNPVEVLSDPLTFAVEAIAHYFSL